jgi:hypothetical protein
LVRVILVVVVQVMSTIIVPVPGKIIPLVHDIYAVRC